MSRASHLSAHRPSTLGTLYVFPIEMPLKSKHLLQYFSQLPPVSDKLLQCSSSKSPCGLRNILMIAVFRHAWNYSRLGTFKQTFLYHKAQTMRLVNEQLRPSAFVPFCADHIITLCFSECTFGNFEAADTHLMGMLSYMETRGNPKDEQEAIAHELCDRYFIVAYNMIQGLKSRVDDYLASPAGAAYTSRCQLSPQELEQLIPEWHSYEANGAGLCLEAMSLLPSFFASSAACPKLNPVNPSHVISCLKGITRIFEMRSSCKRGISHDASPHELWDHGDPSRLFSAVVEAHMESCSPASAVTSGPQKNNTWVQVKECASNEYCCNLDQDNDCCKNNSDRFSLRAPPLHAGQKKPGTPAGVIAGAVVGAVIAIIILTGLGFWFIRRKRQGRSDHNTIMTDQGNEHPPKYSPTSGEAIMEVDAGPETVLVESDAQPIQPRVLHELPA
ncbi:hypothetical protein FBULB1_892 [Fusarium bulbicola]|nr:hypothetical protein FBULB1_892 [Fusarium bulbicola]